MKYDLNNRRFTLISNTAGNAKPGETFFTFEQVGSALRATYSGGGVQLGAIVGLFVSDDTIEVLFQQVTRDGAVNGGKGKMTIERRADGKLYFVDDWAFLINQTGAGRAIWQEI